MNYEPVYGFQRYYYESADVENPNRTTTYYLIQDVDTAELDRYEYEGRIYRPYIERQTVADARKLGRGRRLRCSLLDFLGQSS